MTGYQYLALSAFFVSLIGLIYHFVRLVKLGTPKDFAPPKGNPALVYSFTGSMSPTKKESAYLHFPTYMAGLMYHAGTFAAIALFFPLLLGAQLDRWVVWSAGGILVLSGLCGAGILTKRVVVGKLRFLSNIDDYISNILVTLFQVLTLVALLDGGAPPVYFLCVSILLLYLPLGKLKHLLYFFAARYQLAVFYGRRGIWPLRKREHAA